MFHKILACVIEEWVGVVGLTYSTPVGAVGGEDWSAVRPVDGREKEVDDHLAHFPAVEITEVDAERGGAVVVRLRWVAAGVHLVYLRVVMLFRDGELEVLDRDAEETSQERREVLAEVLPVRHVLERPSKAVAGDRLQHRRRAILVVLACTKAERVHSHVVDAESRSIGMVAFRLAVRHEEDAGHAAAL